VPISIWYEKHQIDMFENINFICYVTLFPKNTQEMEDPYIEENFDHQSIDNISNPDRIKLLTLLSPLNSPARTDSSRRNYDGH